MTNIEQFIRELMLAHDIDYETAQYRAFTFYENLAQDVPSVLNEWISVKDRLPEEDEVVQDNWIIDAEFWQPLPKPPKEK